MEGQCIAGRETAALQQITHAAVGKELYEHCPIMMHVMEAFVRKLRRARLAKERAAERAKRKATKPVAARSALKATANGVSYDFSALNRAKITRVWGNHVQSYLPIL